MYKDIIVGHLFGHKHEDHIYVLKNKAGVINVAPSVYSENNPAVRVVEYDSGNNFVNILTASFSFSFSFFNLFLFFSVSVSTTSHKLTFSFWFLFHADTKEILNIVTYYASLDDSNASGQLQYVKEYDVLSAYHLQPPLNLAKWLELKKKTDHDPAFAALYKKYEKVSYSGSS